MNYSSSTDMNTDVLPEDVPRFEQLAKPKERIDPPKNYNAFKVKPGALSYEISDRINKLAQPRRTSALNSSVIMSDPSNSRDLPYSMDKSGKRRLINSNQHSRDAQMPNRKKFLLDTYARITAARNKRCSKRLLDLSRPKQNQSEMQGNQFQNYDDYFRTIKKYDPSSSASTMTGYKWN